MSTISTFSGFTMARLGIMASQKALEVTGNNISNINTEGYTRQRLDQRALYIGGADRYASQFDVRVGAGALTTGVSQLRDPYLDIRYRNEGANVGFQDKKYSVLESLSLVLDEVGKGEEDNGVLVAQLNDLLAQLQGMNTENAGKDDYDALVRGSAKELVQWLNTYAGALETVRQNTVATFKEDVARVNNILTSIRDLNESIKKAEIANGAMTSAELKAGQVGERGSQALELRDERNLLLDELATYMPIDVKYSDEPIGSGMYVEKLTITVAGDSDLVLVDGIFGGTLAINQVQAENPDGTPMVDNNGNPVMVDDPTYSLNFSALTDKHGTVIRAGHVGHDPKKFEEMTLKTGGLQALREMLTRQGEFSTAQQKQDDPRAGTKRGIPFYQKALDALANQIAKVFNDANTFDPNNPDEKWIYKDPTADPLEIKDEYKDYYVGGPLFSNNGDTDDTAGITAANISIANSWAYGRVHVVPTKKQEEIKLSSANSNVGHLIAAMDKDYEYKPRDVFANAASTDTYFKGSFYGMLAYINDELGQDSKSTLEMLDNYSLASEEISLSRDSVSGVDLNDEAVSMMQYQKSYSAACRLLTTLDEILDKLINGTGVAGR